MWILFAILNPIADASRNIFSKKASLKIDPLIISWSNNVIPLIFFTIPIFFIETKLSVEFFQSLFISGIINIIAVILYHRAISKSDISLVIPMLSFTPLFLLITSPIIVNEFPNVYGIIGIVFIVFGSYLLNVNLKKQNVLEPIKALFKNEGTRLMLIVAFIWSISANYDKRAIQVSSVFQYLFFFNVFVFIGVSIILFLRKKINLNSIKSEKKNLFFLSVFTALGYLFQMTSITLTIVSNVIALKRTSVMISVILGYFFLNEKHIRERLLGSFIMFIGVLIIIFFQR